MLLLDTAGGLVAVVIGMVVFYFGGGFGWAYLLLLLVFLLASVIVTKYGLSKKRDLAIYEYNRGWENVVANGVVPAACVVVMPGTGLLGAYVGSIAAVTADKFSSEIGVLGPTPRRLFDFKPVKRGQSGAMSLLGTFASFDGALLIGVAAYFIFGIYDAWGVLTISVIGFIGGLIDSIVGVFENNGIGNKMTTNFICAIAGAVLGYLFL